jgi:hypothetical protein
MHTGAVWGEGEGKHSTPQENFKSLVNKNAIKPKIGDHPGNFVQKFFTLPGISAKI